MKKRRLVACGLALTMGLLAGCSGQTKTETTTAVAAKEEKAETAETTAAAAADVTPDVTLIGAHVNSDDSSFNIGMVAFADALKDVSGGKMVMEVHGNGELGGDETELVQKMATGTIDVVATSPSFLASVVPEMDLFSMPFLYKDIDHWKAVTTGEVGQSMAQILEDKSDFKITSYWMCGIRSIFSTKEIHNLDDLKGVKIRVHSSENVQAIWRALGAQPTSLAYNELYSGLQNKVIDAAENDLGNILLQKFYEAGPYIALSQHDIATRMCIISKSKYNSLTDEQKAWVDEAAKISQEKQWEYDLSLTETAQKEIEEKGGTFIEVEDIDKWIETVTPVIESVAEKLGVSEQYQKLVELKK